MAGERIILGANPLGTPVMSLVQTNFFDDLKPRFKTFMFGIWHTKIINGRSGWIRIFGVLVFSSRIYGRRASRLGHKFL